jgi:hypothetical protein
VLATPGMSKTLVEQLESLSGYTHVYPAHIPEAKLNPVNFSHLILTTGGRQYHVLSRIGDAGLDYSQRSNKLAHHVALETNELVPPGPAWVLSQRNFMESTFHGEPTIIQAGRKPPAGDTPATVCSHWEQLTGDAGWAGVLAETALQKRAQQAVIVFRPGMDLLPLFVEALNLLPPHRRWEVSFSTYFTRLPSGLVCQWRCVLEGTAECKAAMRLPQALIIDLCGPLGKASAGPLTEAARTGKRPVWPKLEQPAAADVRSTVQVDALARPDAPIAAPPVAATTPRRSATDAGIPLEAYAVDLGPKIATQSGRPWASFPGWFVAVAVLLFLVGTAGGFYAGLLVGRPAAVVSVADASKKNSAITAGKQEASKPAVSSPEVSAPADGNTAPPKAAQAPPADNAKVSESPPKPADPSPQAASPTSPESAAAPQPATTSEVAAAPAPTPVDPTPPPEELWKDLEQRGYILELPPASTRVSAEKPTFKELAKLVLANPAECRLELIGLADAFAAELEPKLEKSGDGTWQVLLMLSERLSRKPREIATFQLDNGTLMFNWGSSPPTLPGVSMLDRIQNCLLRIRIGNQVSRPCALRKPLVCAPANFRFKSSRQQVAVLKDLPQLSEVNVQHVQLAITGVQGTMQAYEIKPEGKQKHRNIVFPFQYGFSPTQAQLEVELRSRLDNRELRIECQSYHFVASNSEAGGSKRVEITSNQAFNICERDKKELPGLNKNLGKLRTDETNQRNVIAALDMKIQQASEKRPQLVPQLQAERKQLHDKLEEIKGEIDQVDNKIKERMLSESYYRQLAETMIKLEGGPEGRAQIDYQVYLELQEQGSGDTAKKHRLILAQTEPEATAQ